MKIGNRYKIESDPLNVILYKKIKRKKKDTDELYDDWATMGCYSNVENALIGLIEQKVKDTELKDLRTIIKEISDLREMIGMALKSSQGRKELVKV